MVIAHSARNFETQITLITQIDCGCENQCLQAVPKLKPCVQTTCILSHMDKNCFIFANNHPIVIKYIVVV
jgi:hypothetical protein